MQTSARRFIHIRPPIVPPDVRFSFLGNWMAGTEYGLFEMSHTFPGCSRICSGRWQEDLLFGFVLKNSPYSLVTFSLTFKLIEGGFALRLHGLSSPDVLD